MRIINIPVIIFKKGIEWERPIHIEFFEADGTLGFSQNAGLRVQGGSTRYLRNKSMRIYASDLYDYKDMFDYPIFPGLLKPNSGETLTHFKSFMLRNSGNDYYQAYFRDGILQSLVSHLGFDTQAYRPAIIFINGEYWGIYNIREDYDEWYIANNYDVDMSEVAILEERDARIEVGVPEDKIHYLEMFKFIEEKVDSGTINDPDVYEYINTLMDIDNFINYFASQIFILNNDWPQNNIRFWRLGTKIYEPDAIYGHDGKWRWMMFDVDSSFSLKGQSVKHNSIRDAKRDKLFSLLLENNEFKYQFINTMSDLINSIFRTEWTIQKIEDTQSVLAPEMLEHLKRWNLMDGSIEQWNENVQKMIEFAQDRPSFQIQHMNEYFSLNGTTEINLIADPQKGYIKINSIELKEGTPGIDNPANWKGIYFKEVPVHLTAVPNPGYEFLGWAEIGNNDPSITITLEEDQTLTAVFKD
ncbi:CotH kinase family protein [Actinomycetota bacterium]